MANADYNNYHGPPPGQGHYPSYPGPGTGYGDDRYEDYDRGRAPPPRRSPPRGSEPYFDPPPREARDRSLSQGPGPYDGPPPAHQQFADYGASPPPNRPLSDTERSRARDPAGSNEYNQVAPYDVEKAEAEWRRGVNDAYSYQRPPPPPSDYSRRRDFDDRTDDRTMYDERDRDRDRDRRYDDRYRDDGGRDERDRRIRRDEEKMKEKVLRYPGDPKKGGRDIFGGSEGERGFGAKLLGGASGALIAHETKGGTLETIGGALVGAIAAGVLEKQYEKRKGEKALRASRAKADDPHVVGYPQPGRDMEDVRRTGRDGVVETDERPHPRTRSRTRSQTGFRDRFRRSVSRARSRSMSRRRRMSSDDDDESEDSRRR